MLSRLFYLLRLQIPSVSGAAPHSLLSILCSMLTSKSVNKLMKEKIVDGLLNLLTLADELMPDPVADISLTKLPKISGKWNLFPYWSLKGHQVINLPRGSFDFNYFYIQNHTLYLHIACVCFRILANVLC